MIEGNDRAVYRRVAILPFLHSSASQALDDHRRGVDHAPNRRATDFFNSLLTDLHRPWRDST